MCLCANVNVFGCCAYLSDINLRNMHIIIFHLWFLSLDPASASVRMGKMLENSVSAIKGVVAHFKYSVGSSTKTQTFHRSRDRYSIWFLIMDDWIFQKFHLKMAFGRVCVLSFLRLMHGYLVLEINKMRYYYLSKKHIYLVLWKTIGTDYASFSGPNFECAMQENPKWLPHYSIFSSYWLLSWCFAVIQYHNKLNYVHKTGCAVWNSVCFWKTCCYKNIPLLQFSAGAMAYDKG